MNPWLMTENLQGEVKTYYDNLYNHLTRFKRNLFVESGTLIGNGIQTALRAGFQKCLSVEIHDWCYNTAHARFTQEMMAGRVQLFKGNSELLMPAMLELVNESATFWLDAHISAQYGEKKAKNCPIMEELGAIKNHHVKDHVILIDDCNCFDNAAHDFISLKAVQHACLEINPAYKFEFLDAVLPNNIMVAYV